MLYDKNNMFLNNFDRFHGYSTVIVGEALNGYSIRFRSDRARSVIVITLYSSKQPGDTLTILSVHFINRQLLF